MNKVFVEYRNIEQMNMLSTIADNPVEAIITVSVPSIDVNGNEDIIYKAYHLYVGKILSVDEIKQVFPVSDEEASKYDGLFVRYGRNLVRLIESSDAVFDDSQSMLNRVDMMLDKFYSLGYEKTAALKKVYVR